MKSTKKPNPIWVSSFSLPTIHLSPLIPIYCPIHPLVEFWKSSGNTYREWNDKKIKETEGPHSHKAEWFLGHVAADCVIIKMIFLWMLIIYDYDLYINWHVHHIITWQLIKELFKDFSYTQLSFQKTLWNDRLWNIA